MKSFDFLFLPWLLKDRDWFGSILKTSKFKLVRLFIFSEQKLCFINFAMFPHHLPISRAPFVSSSSQRTERTNGFFKEKLFNLNLLNFLSCFLTLLIDFQISFTQRFQFLLFDKGNLFVMADNQIQLVMNKINSTNNTKKFLASLFCLCF